MATESTNLTTYVCDLTGCEESITLAGNEAEQLAIAEGWTIDFPIGMREWELCPMHFKELQDWVGEVGLFDVKS